MSQTLGQMEMKVLAYVLQRKVRTVKVGDLAKPFRITVKQERELLFRLAKKKLITRIRRGLYLFPESLPRGSLWVAGQFETVNTLMEDKGACYQICGLDAFNRYGFSTQIPVMMYVYNNRISGKRRIGELDYVFIKVADDRLGGIEELETPEGKVFYSSRERSLVDAIRDYKLFNTLPRAYRWVIRELEEKRIVVKDLVETALRFGDKGTLRRLGLLLELEGISERFLKEIERALPKTKGLISWIPSNPRRGRKIARWGVIYNTGEDDAWRESSDS